MNKLYIMIGVPGAGKSTWIKHYFAAAATKTAVISKDCIRYMIWGENYVFSELTEPLVKDITRESIKCAVDNGFNIIIDETNIRKACRESIKELVTDEYEIIYVVFRNTDTLDRRMINPKGYSRDEWDAVIKGMVNSMEWPGEKECDRLINIYH